MGTLFEPSDNTFAGMSIEAVNAEHSSRLCTQLPSANVCC